MFHLKTPGFDNPEVSWHPVAKLDLDNVAEGELGGLHRDLLTVPARHRVLRRQVLKTLHDTDVRLSLRLMLNQDSEIEI